MPIPPFNDGDSVSASRFNRIVDSTNSAQDRLSALTPEHLKQQARQNNIDFVVIVEEPQENDATLAVKTIQFSPVPPKEDGIHVFSLIEAKPFVAYPQPGKTANDYAPFFHSETKPLDPPDPSKPNATQPNPVDNETPILQMQLFDSRHTVWFPSDRGSDESAIIRSIGTGKELFVTAQFVRFDKDTISFVADGPVEQFFTYGFIQSKHFKPFVQSGSAVDFRRVQDVKSITNEFFIKQTFVFSLRELPSDLRIGDCIPKANL